MLLIGSELPTRLMGTVFFWFARLHLIGLCSGRSRQDAVALAATVDQSDTREFRTGAAGPYGMSTYPSGADAGWNLRIRRCLSA